MSLTNLEQAFTRKISELNLQMAKLTEEMDRLGDVVNNDSMIEAILELEEMGETAANV